MSPNGPSDLAPEAQILLTRRYLARRFAECQTMAL